MDSQKIAGVAWPSVLIVLTGIYAYWAAQRELVSSRPALPVASEVPEPTADPGFRTVRSRIWEDPLSSANADWKLINANRDSESRERQQIPDAALPNDKQLTEELKKLLPDSPCLPPTTDPPASHQSDLPDDGKRTLANLVDKSQRPTLCLPIYVPGGPYAEEKEKRIRTRYAVVTALAEHGYSLKHNNRMSYLAPTIYIRVLRGWDKHRIVVPLKLYAPPSNTDKPWIVVLWID